ncbi:uncharacterized protein CEXT_759901 [Caerostris extrusa]|uniref:Uncharacterized protein n=1 Tax=Caerostris extrusa TaxID=172846 RepID=A0AAV4XD82_CAEEX|nr:uncharacterized protein CEXT_759901 [Caerostris extrusa]
MKRDGWWPFFILMPMTVFWIGCMCFFLGRISTRPGTVQFVMSPQGGEEELQDARDLQEYVNHSASLVRIRRILDFVARAPQREGAPWIVLPGLQSPDTLRSSPRKGFCGDPVLLTCIEAGVQMRCNSAKQTAIDRCPIESEKWGWRYLRCSRLHGRPSVRCLRDGRLLRDLQTS